MHFNGNLETGKGTCAKVTNEKSVKRYCEIEELDEGCNPGFDGTGCFCRDKDLCNGNENLKHSDFIILIGIQYNGFLNVY